MKKVSTVAKTKSVKTEEAKKTNVKAEPVKTEVVKQEKLAGTEKAAPVVEQKTEKKAIAEKTVEKKTAEKKAVVKKAAEKKAVVAVQEEIFIQFGNQEVFTANVVERVKNAYIAEGHTAESIKKVRVYIKPEENMIYYVVNDDYASGISLF